MEPMDSSSLHVGGLFHCGCYLLILLTDEHCVQFGKSCLDDPYGSGPFSLNESDEPQTGRKDTSKNTSPLMSVFPSLSLSLSLLPVISISLPPLSLSRVLWFHAGE